LRREVASPVVIVPPGQTVGGYTNNFPYAIPNPNTTRTNMNIGGNLADPANPGTNIQFVTTTIANPQWGRFTEAWDWGPSSQHPGGAFHLMGDASVQWLADGVNVLSYYAMCTRSGKEPTGDTGAGGQ